jgi:putrescine transport system ATP-binding protein
MLRFDHVTKRFGVSPAVSDLSLDVYEGEFFALLGASGCGKTTLLRLAAGFDRPDHGRVLLDGKDLTGIPPHRRPINMMFQNYALFPHLTVERNIAFGLKQEAVGKSEIAVRVREMLALVKLEGFGPRRPAQLSGGERQRVALARSLVKRPKVLLLDEPLAALDKTLREQTQAHLIDLHRKLGTTFLIVTHDRQEAMTLAGRIAVMDRGRIVQVGTPTEIYERPMSRYVAELVGDVNFIEAHLVAAGGSEAVIEGPGSVPLLVCFECQAKVGTAVVLALRPEKVQVWAEPPAQTPNVLHGQVTEIAYLGNVSVYKIRLDAGPELKSMVANTATTNARSFAVEDRVWVSFAPGAGMLIVPQTPEVSAQDQSLSSER